MLVRDHLKGYEAAPNLLLNERIKEMQRAGQDVHNLAFGQSPFPVFDKAKEALCQHAGIAEYLAIDGIYELRKEIAEFHQKTDELQFEANSIIVGPGTKQLSFLLFTVFDGEIYLPSPCWTTYQSQVKLANQSLVVVQTDFSGSWKYSPTNLENAFQKSTKKKLLLLINPDNPTGVCYTEEEIQAIAIVCRKHQVIVLSDEIYALLHFEGNHVSIAKHYPERTILQNGISKWGSAGGWRLGYHIYPEGLRELQLAVRNASSHSHSCASAPIQYAALEYFKYDEDCSNYVKHCRRILKAVSEFCFNKLTSVGLKAIKPNGTFYMMVDFEILRDNAQRQGITTGVQLGEWILTQTKVGIMPCGPGFLRPETEFTFRVCYINFDGQEAIKGSQKLGFHHSLSEDFVSEYCKDTVRAIEAIVSWVKQITGYKK